MNVRARGNCLLVALLVWAPVLGCAAGEEDPTTTGVPSLDGDVSVALQFSDRIHLISVSFPNRRSNWSRPSTPMRSINRCSCEDWTSSARCKSRLPLLVMCSS